MLGLVADLLSHPHSPLSRLPSSQSNSHLFNSYFVSENYFGTSLSYPLFYSCLPCATIRPYFHWVLHFFLHSALKYSSAVPYGGATLLLFHDYIRYVTVYTQNQRKMIVSALVIKPTCGSRAQLIPLLHRYCKFNKKIYTTKIPDQVILRG